MSPEQHAYFRLSYTSSSDHSGTITYDEFKNVYSSNIGPDAIPFDFDWYVNLNRRRRRWCDGLLPVTGLSCIWARRTELMSWAVRTIRHTLP